MKQFILICLFLICILISCGKSDEKQIPIAILTPITHPSLEKAENGFKQSLEASNPGKYRFVTYNAQGNKTLMRSEIEEIAQKDYALVFTLGTSASQMATEVFNKKRIETPIVFTCVNDPVGFHIVFSEETPGGNITGVKEMLHFDAELEALLRYKPSIQNIVLVYNPAEPGLQKDQQEIDRILKQKNITLQTIEAFQTNEILAKVSPFMSIADAVIVLKDNTVISGLDVLVKLCNRYQIPLMTSDLDSPDRGAAFGYGVYEVDFGIEGAKKALQILVEGVQPGSIPVTHVSEFTLRINSEAAKRQGIDLP
jgi:putative tryptophan/tyrosine transport system substrate-binding protein